MKRKFGVDRSWGKRHTFIMAVLAGTISGILATILYATVVYPLVAQKPQITILCGGLPFGLNNSIIDRNQIDIINHGSGPQSYLNIKVQTFGKILDYSFNQNQADFKVINTTIPHGYSLELVNQIPIQAGTDTQFIFDTVGQPGLVSIITTPHIDNISNASIYESTKPINLYGKCS